MLLIQNKKFNFGLIFPFALLAQIGAIAACAGENEPQNKNPIFVAGLDKSQEDQFAKNMDRIDREYLWIQEAEKHLSEKRYQDALNILKKAFHQVNPNNKDSWMVRRTLLDVYEAMGDRENFTKEIDWLIAHCQNEKTKKAFVERKQVFLNKTAPKKIM